MESRWMLELCKLHLQIKTSYFTRQAGNCDYRLAIKYRFKEETIVIEQL